MVRSRVDVREATTHDASLITPLYVRLLLSYGHHASENDIHGFLQHLLSESWTRFIIATDASGSALGFAGCSMSYSAVSHAPALIINDLFVDAAARRQGIATKLCTAIERVAQRDGCAKLFVEADSSAREVVSLYRKMGFVTNAFTSMTKELPMTKSTKPAEGVDEAFSYLSVVTSIVLGLGFTALLSCYATLIQTQPRAISAIYLGWIALLLPLYVLYWWAFWDYRKLVEWSFASFFLLLVGPMGLSLATTLLSPDSRTNDQFSGFDRYVSVRFWLFSIFIVLQVWGIILSPWLRDGFSVRSFFNRYKIAQHILLLSLVIGCCGATGTEIRWWADVLPLVVFWLVVLYLVSTHRRTLPTS